MQELACEPGKASRLQQVKHDPGSISATIVLKSTSDRNARLISVGIATISTLHRGTHNPPHCISKGAITRELGGFAQYVGAFAQPWNIGMGTGFKGCG